MSKRKYRSQDSAALKEAKRMLLKGYKGSEVENWLPRLYDDMTETKAKKITKKAFSCFKGEGKAKNPVRIPEKVLAWRERQRKGSIMKSKTFKGIKRKAKRAGYAIPSAVGGKAYWITVLNKYLDKHPGDKTAMGTLRKLLKGGAKRSRKKLMGQGVREYWNRYSIGNPKRRNPKKLVKDRASYSRWYVGMNITGMGKVTYSRPFVSYSKPTKRTHSQYSHVFGPFLSRVDAKRFK